MKWFISALCLSMLPALPQGYSRVRRQATCPSSAPCEPLRDCPEMLKLLRIRNSANYQKLRDNTCVYDRRNPFVCCPKEKKPPIATNREDLLPASCGHSIVDNKIVGGENADLGAYPWIAILGYGPSNDISWQCGGSLINNRYVVTATHCTLSEYTGFEGIDVVRLGEHNLATARDCETSLAGQNCAPPVQDFSVESIIRHPDFNTREQVSDDIALLRLDREVQFTAWIQPICLPTKNAASLPSVRSSNNVIVSGWGVTDTGATSKILQEVDVPFVDKATCRSKWPGVNLLPEQICFGAVDGKDSCNGDSGGPLIHPKNDKSPPYDLIGIVSYGTRRCGDFGIPAVYTDVASYRSWITSNLKP